MKAKFGAIVVDGRGKLGGHVFSKNAAGAYMRTKTTPTNPQTAFQTAVRALFATISAGWSQLTEEVRTAWNSAVPEWQTTDVFGDLKKPTGKALYQRLNNQAQASGWPAVLAVPARQALPGGVPVFAAMGLVAGDLAIDPVETAATSRTVLFATTTLSAGTSFVKNKLRQFYDEQSDAYSQTDAFAAYIARFGTPAVGDNIKISIKYVLDNGQTTVPVILPLGVAA